MYLNECLVPMAKIDCAGSSLHIAINEGRNK